MKLTEILSPDCVRVPLKAADKTGVITELVDRRAEGVILGCTEIPLLVSEADAGVPLLDTTVIHAEAALNYALYE